MVMVSLATKKAENNAILKQSNNDDIGAILKHSWCSN